MTVVTHDRRFSGSGEDFGIRFGTLSVHLHTWESGPFKTTIKDAIAGMVWQDRDDTLGSYNRVMCTDGVLRCMDDFHASGGINPSSVYFKPRAWLTELLPAYAVRDPNGWGVNFCAMGSKAQFDQEGWPGRIIDGFARSIIEIEELLFAKTGKRPNLVVDLHADYQPGNRSDAGAACLALVMKRYQEITAPQPPAPPKEDFMNIVQPTGKLLTGVASFYSPATQYDLFTPGPNPDPATFERAIYRTPADRGSSAPVDGPWGWTGHDAGWWRITAGPLTGKLLSRNGPQARIDLDEVTETRIEITWKTAYDAGQLSVLNAAKAEEAKTPPALPGE